jgi:two-component system cell cycle response regulator
MEKRKDYRISMFGEFADQSIEDEFLAENLSGSARMTANIALVFGFILGLFLVNSYFSEGSTPLFARTTPIRLVFIFSSMVVFFIARSTRDHRHLRRTITLYQGIMVMVYFLTLRQYDFLTYFSILGLMVITLAMYLLPNKIVLSQITSVLFSILCFAELSQKVTGLQAGDFHRIVAYQTILLIYCNLNYFWAETTKRKTFIANRELLDLSSKDPLTGIFNRKKFDDAMEEWMNVSRKNGEPLALILFDIDNFKGINDNYGHIVGDGVLKDLATTVGQSIRDTDVFARWGGDEFVILLPNTDAQQAEEIAERIRTCVANSPCESLGDITCSFGVAEYEEGDTKQSLLRRVDDLLLQGKAGGKGRVVS